MSNILTSPTNITHTPDVNHPDVSEKHNNLVKQYRNLEEKHDKLADKYDSLLKDYHIENQINKGIKAQLEFQLKLQLANFLRFSRNYLRKEYQHEKEKYYNAYIQPNINNNATQTQQNNQKFPTIEDPKSKTKIPTPNTKKSMQTHNNHILVHNNLMTQCNLHLIEAYNPHLEKYNTLKAAYNTLQEAHNFMDKGYFTLQAIYRSIYKENKALRDTITLQEKIDDQNVIRYFLQEECNELNKKITELKHCNRSTQPNNNNLAGNDLQSSSSSFTERTHKHTRSLSL